MLVLAVSRVPNGWGHALMILGAAFTVISLCWCLRRTLRQKANKTAAALTLVAVFVILLAFWMASIGDISSFLIIVGALLPSVAACFGFVRVLMAFMRRRKISQAIILMGGALTAAIATCVGAWIVTMPEPFVRVSESSLELEFPRPLPAQPGSLERVYRQASDLGSLAFIVVQDDELIAEWGNTDKPTDAHSVRKSILSALFGIAEHKGLVDITSTLEEVGIDDERPALTKAERQATIEDLLTSRSAIYHPYIGDEEGNRPRPGSHRPGTFFFYNNWSFNALGTVFEQETGLSIGVALQQWIANPIGMQDYSPEHVLYEWFPHPTASIHRPYKIWISARDLARFGALLSRSGIWDGEQIIPSRWIRVSTEAYCVPGRFGYGYSWWRSVGDPEWLSDSMFFATGTGGQKLLVDPERNLVAVHRTDSHRGLIRGIWTQIGPKVNNEQFLSLVRQVLDATEVTGTR